MSDKTFSEEWAVVACIDPDAYTAATYTSDVVDMSLWEQIVVVTMAGTMGNGASIVTTVKDSSASPHAAIAGKTTTIGVSGGSPTTGNDSQKVIHLRSSELNSNARYVTVTMQVTDATSDAGLIIFGQGRYRPASDNDLASVAEIVD